MNKERIVSDISIEFGLSKEKSEKAVTAVLNCVLKAINKEEDLVIQKFGKFRMSSGKDGKSKKSIKFTPARKLALRVNSDFKNLKKVKVKKNLKAADKHFKKFDIKLPPELSDEMTGTGWVNNGPDNNKQRNLISDDLISLHKEITKDLKKNP